MWVGTSNQPPIWNGIRPLHTVFNYVRAARVAIESNNDAPYKWMKVAWQTTNSVGFIVRDVAGEAFLLVARSYIRQRPRVYRIQDGLVRWGRGQRLGDPIATSVRAWSFFKFFIRVVGATSTYTSPAPPVTDYDISHWNQAVAGSVFNCSAWATAAQHEHDHLYHSGDPALQVRLDLRQLDVGNLGAECGMIYASALTNASGTSGVYVSTVQAGETHLPTGYAFSANGVLKFCGTVSKIVPMYWLFFLLLGISGALGGFIPILQQAGALNIAFGRPLDRSEKAWMAESVRAIQRARHALHTLIGLLRPHTTKGGYNDYLPVAAQASILRIVNSIAALHASACPERPDVANDSSSSVAPPCEPDSTCTPCSPRPGWHEEVLSPAELSRRRAEVVDHVRSGLYRGHLEQPALPGIVDVANSQCDVPCPNHSPSSRPANPLAPTPPPPPPSPAEQRFRSEIAEHEKAAHDTFALARAVLRERVVGVPGMFSGPAVFNSTGTGPWDTEHDNIFTLDDTGEPLTITRTVKTEMTQVSIRSVADRDGWVGHSTQCMLDYQTRSCFTNLTFEVGTKLNTKDYPRDLPGISGESNVCQATVAFRVHGVRYKFTAEDPNVKSAIDGACYCAKTTARDATPYPIQPLAPNDSRMKRDPSSPHERFPVPAIRARCDTFSGSPEQGDGMAIVFEPSLHRHVVIEGVSDPIASAMNTLDTEYDPLAQYSSSEFAMEKFVRRSQWAFGGCLDSNGVYTRDPLTNGTRHEHSFGSVSVFAITDPDRQQFNSAILDARGVWHVFYNVVNPQGHYREFIRAHTFMDIPCIVGFTRYLVCGSHTSADVCEDCPAIYWKASAWTRSDLTYDGRCVVPQPVPSGAASQLRASAPRYTAGPPQRSAPFSRPNSVYKPVHQPRHRSQRTAVGTRYSRNVKHCAVDVAERDFKSSGHVESAILTVIAMVTVFVFAARTHCGYVVASVLALAVLAVSAYPIYCSVSTRQTYAVTDTATNRWFAAFGSRSSPAVTVRAVARKLSKKELRRQRPSRARRLRQRLNAAGHLLVVPDSTPVSSRLIKWVFACLAVLALVTVWATDNAVLYNARTSGSVGADREVGASSVTNEPAVPAAELYTQLIDVKLVLKRKLLSDQAGPLPGTAEWLALHGSHTPTTDQQLCSIPLPAAMFVDAASTFHPPACSTSSRPFAVHTYSADIHDAHADTLAADSAQVHRNKHGEPVDRDPHQDAGDLVYFTNDSAAEAMITPFQSDIYEMTSFESIKVTGYNGESSRSVGRGTIRYRYMVEDGTWHERAIHNVTVMPCAKQRLFGQAHDNDGGVRQLDALRYNLTPHGRQPVIRFRNLFKYAAVIMHKDRESMVPRGALGQYRRRAVAHLHAMDDTSAHRPATVLDTNADDIAPPLCNFFATSTESGSSDTHNALQQKSLRARRNAAVERISFPLLHARLCYPDVRFLQKMGKRVPAGYLAPDAVHAKQCKKNVSTLQRTNETVAGAKVFMDIAGPFSVSIGTPFKFVIGFTDSATGRSWAYPMRRKSESNARLQQFILDLRQYDVEMHTLVTDNDSVFKTQDFKATCAANSVHRQFSAPECQYQNGRAESFVNRCKHLGSAALAGCRVTTDVRGKYTVHAMLHAAHASNFIAKVSGISPVQAWAKLTNTLPTSMHDLRTFGAKCWVYDSAHKGLAPRALEARVLGCATACGLGEYDSDTWLVHILSTNALRVSRHVVFNEPGTNLSAEQVAHQALLIATWTEQFKLKGPTHSADTVADDSPDRAFTAHDEPDLGNSTYHTVLATKGSNPGPAADAVRFTDGTIVLGPSIDRAPTHIKQRCINRVGTKVVGTMGTSFTNKHGTSERYRRTDLGYDLVNHYIAIAVPAQGPDDDQLPTDTCTAPRTMPVLRVPVNAARRPPALAVHTHPMQGMFTVQVPQSVRDIADIFGVGTADVISHATNHVNPAGQPMRLTANTRFTAGADIRIPLNAVVPADVTLTQIPAPPPVGPAVNTVSAPDTAPVGAAVRGRLFDAHDRENWLLDDKDRMSIAAFREQYAGSADVFLSVDDEMYLFRKKSHAPFSLHAFSMPTDDMPSVKGALSGPHRDKWLAAIEAEYNSLDEHNTWVLVPKPRHARAIDVKLVLKRKRDRHGEITKYKARLVLRGDQCEPYDALTQLYTPVACIPSFRLMCSIAAEYDYELCSLDFTTAFLNADCNTTVYAKQASYREIKLDDNGVPMVYSMRKSCYGLPFAPKLWHDMLHKWITEYGFARSVHDPCVYTLGKLVILIYVDDLSILFPTQEKPAYNKFLVDLAKKFKYTGGGPIDHFLGYGVTRDRKASTLKIDQFAFIDTMLKEHAKHDDGDASVPVHIPHKSDVRLGIQLCPGDDAEGLKEKAIMKTKPFREVVGSLLWLMRGTRPDLAYVVGMLGRVMHNPGLAHWSAALQALAYVRTTRLLTLTYSRSGVPMDCSVDADWLPNYGTEFDNWKSTSGYHVYNANAAVTWRSKRQDVIATSTPHAECLAAYEVIRDVILMRGLKADMGHEEPKPTVLQEDNQTLVRTSLNESGTDRIKHWDYKVHWIRQCVADGIVTFAWVNSADQMSDTATKPLPRPAFERQRDHNMGIVKAKFKVHTEIFRENAHKFDDATCGATANNKFAPTVSGSTAIAMARVLHKRTDVEPLEQLDFTTAYLSA